MKKITQRRKELKLTQKQVAKELGVRVATISDFETGKTGMNTDTFIKYLNLLDMDITDRNKLYIEEIKYSKKRYDECQKRIDATDRRIDDFIKKLESIEVGCISNFEQQDQINDSVANIFMNLFKNLNK